MMPAQVAPTQASDEYSRLIMIKVFAAGDYACLRMRLRLSRLMNYFIWQLYLPTAMIVMVSWVSVATINVFS